MKENNTKKSNVIQNINGRQPTNIPPGTTTPMATQNNKSTQEKPLMEIPEENKQTTKNQDRKSVTPTSAKSTEEKLSEKTT